ncbi:MAG: hypothetical protein EBU85_06855, partial [Actinobacteria bacterium]|nr:hypothetical protein [Actinomycetota bacterium]
MISSPNFPKVSKAKKRTGRVYFRICGARHVINLGAAVNQKQRRSFLNHLNRLIGAKSAGVKPDKADLEWVAQLPDRVHEQIHQRGLCAARIKEVVFADYLDEYFKNQAVCSRAAVSTVERWQTARGHARNYFGSRTLQSLTREDAQKFRNHLLGKAGQCGKTMSDATVRKNCSIVSGAVVEAVKRGLIASNPFDAVPKGNIASPDSEKVVPADEVLKVINFTDSPEDKILLGLARFAGLRIPSEIQEMRWSDVQFGTGLLEVHAIKTKRHGKTRRVIPMDPRLVDILKSCKPKAASEEDFVLPYLRTHSALGVRFRRLCRGAGVALWDKCFTSLRKSFASEMCKDHSPADVAAWLGNTTPVFIKHYLRQQGEGYTRKVAAEFAAQAGGVNSGGTPRQNRPFGVVATAVASAAATNRHGRS